jgi:hypothetical protein
VSTETYPCPHGVSEGDCWWCRRTLCREYGGFLVFLVVVALVFPIVSCLDRPDKAARQTCRELGWSSGRASGGQVECTTEPYGWQTLEQAKANAGKGKSNK